MTFDLVLTLGVLVAVFVALMMDFLSADAVMLGGLIVVVLGGVIDLDRALLTNIVTNNGAVALMFPIAPSVAESQGLAPRALMVSMTLAASMAFITPIGYQTNLMVYGPGNYRFLDFARVGGPLQVLMRIVLLLTAPLVWPM